MKTIEFSTSQKCEIVDLTCQLKDFVSKLKIEEGICLIFTPHATAAVILNENEPGLKNDIIFKARTIFSGKYEHDKIDNNAQAHLAASFFGQSVTIPIIENKLVLGTWQRLLFCEFDGPRPNRKIFMIAE